MLCKIGSRAKKIAQYGEKVRDFRFCWGRRSLYTEGREQQEVSAQTRKASSTAIAAVNASPLQHSPPSRCKVNKRP